MGTVARSSAGVSSLGRAVLVLEAFDVGVRDLSLTELSDRAGMPLSTAHRIVAELVTLGLLERTPQRRYRIGLRMWELAVRTPGALGIREIAMPILRGAHTSIGQHLQLSILDGHDVIHLERLSAAHATVNFSVVGGRMPFHATSSGLVLAAFAATPRRDELIDATLPQFYSAPQLDSGELRRELDSVRRRGYATTMGYIDAAATSIAVPVIDPFGVAIAAIAAIVPSEDPHEQQVLGVILPAAAAIGRALRKRYDGSAFD